LHYIGRDLCKIISREKEVKIRDFEKEKEKERELDEMSEARSAKSKKRKNSDVPSIYFRKPNTIHNQHMKSTPRKKEASISKFLNPPESNRSLFNHKGSQLDVSIQFPPSSLDPFK